MSTISIASASESMPPSPAAPKERKPTRLRPLGDRILIEAYTPPTTSPGGIHIPQGAQPPSQTGVVMDVGPGRVVSGVLESIPVQIGDSVLYSNYGGTKIEIAGIPLLVLRPDDIIGVLEFGEAVPAATSEEG